MKSLVAFLLLLLQLQPLAAAAACAYEVTAAAACAESEGSAHEQAAGSPAHEDAAPDAPLQCSFAALCATRTVAASAGGPDLAVAVSPPILQAYAVPTQSSASGFVADPFHPPIG